MGPPGYIQWCITSTTSDEPPFNMLKGEAGNPIHGLMLHSLSREGREKDHDEEGNRAQSMVTLYRCGTAPDLDRLPPSCTHYPECARLIRKIHWRSIPHHWGMSMRHCVDQGASCSTMMSTPRLPMIDLISGWFGHRDAGVHSGAVDAVVAPASRGLGRVDKVIRTAEWRLR